MKKAWRSFLRFIGYAHTICEIKDGTNSIKLRSDGWVIITDGNSTDVLPLELVSQGLVEKFIKKIGEDNER